MGYTKSFPEDHDFNYRYVVDGWNVRSNVFPVTTVGTRSGTRVPDWREKIARGQNASSDFTSNRIEILERDTGNVHMDATHVFTPSSVRTETFEGFVVRPSDGLGHYSPATNVAEAAALQRILAKIRSEYQKLNSAAVVAEGLDVIRQFGAPFAAICDLTNRRLNRLYLESRGLKGSTAFRKLKWAEIVASTWLEYSFGLKPLISDSVKAAEALAHWQDEADNDFRYRSRVVGRGTSNFTTQSEGVETLINSDIGRVYIKARRRDSTDYRVQYVCGLGASHRADIGSNDRLLQLLGFNPENWVPAIWEVVPWSWLIDYFSNVGQIMQAAVTSTADVKWTCKTVSYETVVHQTTPVSADATRSLLAAYNYKLRSLSGHAGQWKTRRTTVTRDADATLGCPPLVISHPFEDGTKLANMAAVLLNRRQSSSALWLT